jgi:hypothetical protein
VEDWRCENLRDDVADLRKRTHELETWQMLLPMRMFIGVCWIFNVGMIVFAVARAAAH